MKSTRRESNPRPLVHEASVLPLRYNRGPKRESLLGLVAVVEDILHRVDVRRLGSGDQEGVASQRPVQIVADVGAVL